MYGDFISSALISVLQFGGVGVSSYLLYKTIKARKVSFLNEGLHQTIGDRSCSCHIIGLPDSGKTFLAMILFLRDISKGYGALWMSTQGVDNSDLLNYIPKDKINKVILLRPYDNRPLGINLLRTYTNSQLERSLIADSVVTLFKRLFDKLGENMEGILTAAVLSLLEYADKTKEKVSIWDLYIFLSDEGYRRRAMSYVENMAVLDMMEEIDDEKGNAKTSLAALLRRFRKLLYHSQMVAFLSQKEDDIDLLEAVKQRKIIICDFLAGGVGANGIGKENSRFLAELVVSKFQLIAETRNINSSLYPLYLDEFHDYTSTAENIGDFIALNRQRRMPVNLINQWRYQLPKALQSAVDACGTKYIGKLSPEDWKHYKKMYPHLEDRIENLKNREFIYDIRSYGKNYDFIKTSPDIGEVFGFGDIIKENNRGKCTVKEIINHAVKSKVAKVDLSEFQ